MASKNTEVLDPAASVQKLEQVASRRALNRRHFMAAIGAAGAATGAALLSERKNARPNTVQAAAFTQNDVLNFLLNLEYLQATFYSYITQGTDIPPTLTTSSGAITGNPTAKLVFTGSSAAQITDMLNEAYFDEIQHVTILRNILGSTAINRPAINLAAYAAITASNALGLARLFSDLTVTAYTGVASMLTAGNLTYAGQILAVEGLHSGMLRLASIQNPTIAPFYPSTASATFTGVTTSGSTTIIVAAAFGTVLPAVGQTIAGPDVAAAATISAISNTSSIAITGTIASGSATVTAVSSTSTIKVGQVLTGTGIPLGATILTISGTTLTMSANATASTAALAITVITSTVTMSKAAVGAGYQTFLTSGGDPIDVAPADLGATAAAAGPSGSGTSGYAGFYAVAGTGAASSSNPVGTAFARTTSQVLAVLYSALGVPPNAGNAKGGFFPNGVGGIINTI